MAGDVAVITRALRGAGTAERRRHYLDPLGDLEAGRFDGLVAAVLADVGLGVGDRVL